MKIIKDPKITVELKEDYMWNEINSIDEPSLVVYEIIRPSEFNNFLNNLDTTRLDSPKFFIKKLKIESYPKVTFNEKMLVVDYNPFVEYESEYVPLGVIYVDKYNKKKPDETIIEMIENLAKEKRLEVKIIEG
jgi:hypothetical protein